MHLSKEADGMGRLKPTTLIMLRLAVAGAVITATAYILIAKTDSTSTSLPAPAYAGGTKAITLTPVVGKPQRKYADTFIPGEEKLGDGEMRVTVLGSGNPWVT